LDAFFGRLRSSIFKLGPYLALNLWEGVRLGLGNFLQLLRKWVDVWGMWLSDLSAVTLFCAFSSLAIFGPAVRLQQFSFSNFFFVGCLMLCSLLNKMLFLL
jgi:hypothetical protein